MEVRLVRETHSDAAMASAALEEEIEAGLTAVSVSVEKKLPWAMADDTLVYRRMMAIVPPRHPVPAGSALSSAALREA